MQYIHRLQYSRSMWRPDSYLMVANDQYKQFLDTGEVDVGVLAQFIQTLAPRSVADMKPMLVLIQVCECGVCEPRFTGERKSRRTRADSHDKGFLNTQVQCHCDHTATFSPAKKHPPPPTRSPSRVLPAHGGSAA